MRTKIFSAILMFLLAFVTQASESEIQSSFKLPPLRRVGGVEEVVIATPFRVRTVRGMIYYGEKEPLSGVSFELHASDGRLFKTKTDENGMFTLNDVPPGTYDFRATHYGFNPTSGKVIVSGRAPAKAAISVRLELAT